MQTNFSKPQLKTVCPLHRRREYKGRQLKRGKCEHAHVQQLSSCSYHRNHNVFLSCALQECVGQHSNSLCWAEQSKKTSISFAVDNVALNCVGIKSMSKPIIVVPIYTTNTYLLPSVPGQSENTITSAPSLIVLVLKPFPSGKSGT